MFFKQKHQTFKKKTFSKVCEPKQNVDAAITCCTTTAKDTEMHSLCPEPLYNYPNECTSPFCFSSQTDQTFPTWPIEMLLGAGLCAHTHTQTVRRRTLRCVRTSEYMCHRLPLKLRAFFVSGTRRQNDVVFFFDRSQNRNSRIFATQRAHHPLCIHEQTSGRTRP